MIPGRMCPIDYIITDEDYSDIIENFETVYIIGGLYGNKFSLKRIKELQDEEEISTGIRPKLIFNGDMHWFDYKYEDFLEIERMSDNSIKLLGNVEAELLRENDIGAGCGCSYPDNVSLESVERSNRIHSKMKNMFCQNDDLINMINGREKVTKIAVGNATILVTHGDESSLSGWGLSRESLSEETRQNEVYSFMKLGNIDIISSSHTCEQVVLRFKDKIILNNGAAGMSCFKEDTSGIITRISIKKSKSTANVLYSTNIKDVFAEQLRVDFDKDNFIKWFDHNWEKGSEAEISYRKRINSGACSDFCIIDAQDRK